METVLTLLGLSVAILILILVLRANPWPARYTICGALLIWHFIHPRVFPTVWPPFYWAWPIRAQVVDAQTLQPLEGVRVTASWRLVGDFYHHSKQLVEMETFTNSEGRFLFWWFRPRLRWSLYHHIWQENPALRFYKRGYGVSWRDNETSHSRHSPLLWSDWHGKIIPLKKQTAEKSQTAR